MREEISLDVLKKYYETNRLGELRIDYPACDDLRPKLSDIFRAIFNPEFFEYAPCVESVKSICLYGKSLHLNYPKVKTTRLVPVTRLFRFNHIEEQRIPVQELVPSIDFLVLSDQKTEPKATKVSVGKRLRLESALYADISTMPVEAAVSVHYITQEHFLDLSTPAFKETLRFAFPLFGQDNFFKLLEAKGQKVYPRQFRVSWFESPKGILEGSVVPVEEEKK